MRRLPIIIIIVIVVLAAASITGWKFLQSANNELQNPASHNIVENSGNKDKAEENLACAQNMPLEFKLGQKIVLAGYSDTLDNHKDILNQYSIGGVILMNQTSEPTISSFKKSQRTKPIVAVDQEGGTVQRYKSEGALPGASEMTQLSVDEAYQRYQKDSRYLASFGINVNFAPVVDVEYPGHNPLLGRMYSNDPAIVVDYARAFIRAQKEAGIAPVIKHFPGMGSATGNTDFMSAVTDKFAKLQNKDLVPYTKLASQHPDVMVSNAIIPGLSGGLPASLSADVIRALRQDYGYQKAVVYTDSLTANAIPGTLGRASVRAWQAGADVALVVQTRRDRVALDALAQEIVNAGKQAVQDKSLSKQELNSSIVRLMSLKQIDPCQMSLGESGS